MMNVHRKKGGTLSSLVIKERLLGHSGIVKTDKNYFWTDTLDLVPDYLSGMEELMINEEFKLKRKLEDVQLESEKCSKIKTENTELKIRLNEMEAKINRMIRYQSHHE